MIGWISSRAAAGMIAALFALLPMSMPAMAQPAGTEAATSISGTVSDGTGEPVGGATVALRGPMAYTTTTNADGVVSLAGVAPGIYVLTVSKPGYSTAVQNDVVVLAGQTQDFTVRIDRATFSSLRTIASVQ